MCAAGLPHSSDRRGDNDSAIGRALGRALQQRKGAEEQAVGGKGSCASRDKEAEVREKKVEPSSSHGPRKKLGEEGGSTSPRRPSVTAKQRKSKERRTRRKENKARDDVLVVVAAPEATRELLPGPAHNFRVAVLNGDAAKTKQQFQNREEIRGAVLRPSNTMAVRKTTARAN